MDPTIDLLMALPRDAKDIVYEFLDWSDLHYIAYHVLKDQVY